MAVRGAKTIAEYAIYKWVEDNFLTGYIELMITGKKGTLTDRNGDMLTITYDNETHTIYVS